MSELRGQAIKCRAAVCRGPNLPVTVEDVVIDPPARGEVRVKIVANGICHTDAHLVTGHIKGCGLKFRYPTLLGHEGSGVVESLGEGVTSVAPGDKVLVTFHPKCNQCYLCKVPHKTNLCTLMDKETLTMLDGTVRTRTLDGSEVYNFGGVGALAEYLVLSEARVAKIDQGAPLDKVCLLSCGITTGYGSVVNTAKVRPGSTVGIWGLGTVGLAVACGARESGATKIVGIDTNPSKFELAKQFGCTDFINPNDLGNSCDSVVAAVRSLTAGLGVDYAFECIGFRETMSTAVKSTASGWGVTVLNGLVGGGGQLELDAPGILSGKTVTGAYLGGYQGKNDLPKLVDMYMEGKLPVEPFISGTVNLDAVNEAFDLLLAGKALRTVVLM